jgi:hypothetical protein
MNTMEFEEMQQIWDSQNNKHLFVINEEALHNRIQSKKKQASHITNVSEVLLIAVNLAAGIFILWLNLFQPDINTFMFVIVAWMFVTSLYLLTRRIQRIKGDRRFDRSLDGDLRHAISTATYQVHLSQVMRWNILPIGALSLVAMREGGKPLWALGLTLILFIFAYFAGGWEHNLYKQRKRELEMLSKKLGTNAERSNAEQSKPAG